MSYVYKFMDRVSPFSAHSQQLAQNLMLHGCNRLQPVDFGSSTPVTRIHFAFFVTFLARLASSHPQSKSFLDFFKAYHIRCKHTSP